MATQKAALHEHEITVRLSDEEYELLQAFADEKGIADLSLVIPKMIHELVELSDRLWDAQFARSPELLKKMAQEALDEHHARLTEDMP
jgi:hypothetical protein